jgi:hypothetical protein
MFGRRRWGGNSIHYAASEELFRDSRHKHAMRFCMVCVTDVEAAGDALSLPYFSELLLKNPHNGL